MARLRNKAPIWFWVIAGLLLAWNVIGVFACVMQLRLGAASWPDAMDYDRRVYMSLPVWYNWVYAIATFGGLAAAILLLLRRALATPLFLVSLVAIIVMFGYVLGVTDMIAHKGFLTAAGFPIVIFAIGVISLWLARTAAGRGWLA